MATEESLQSGISDEAKADLNTLLTDTNNAFGTTLNISEEAALLRRLLRANGIYRPEDMDYLKSFYRTRRIDPYYLIESGTFEYLFFTKPDMNILNKENPNSLNSEIFEASNIYGVTSKQIGAGTAAVPYFNELLNSGYIQTLNDLCYTNGSDKCPFVRILSNRKISNLDMPDISVTELETGQNMYGTKLFYPTNSLKADEDAEFSIDFEDTQFLEVYHFFKAYDMYRKMKWSGLIMPYQSHIDNKILGDHMSIYKFIVDNDGETILYYAKATGVYPKSISRSSFSEIEVNGQLKITVTFKLSGWIEDMDPSILVDFNRLVAHWVNEDNTSFSSSNEISIYDDEINAVNGDNIRYFYIDKARPNGRINKQGYHRYYLVGCK